MEQRAKETVIIVHGTWAEPKPGRFSWYQIPEKPEHEPNFVSKLDVALKRRGSRARCWAHCKDNCEIFTWCGSNAWIDRTRAASKLAEYINKLQAHGWKYHIVAHSHGGNIVAEALPHVEARPKRQTCRNGTVTTLGTPFIDVMSPISERMARRSRLTNLVAWLVFWPSVVMLLAAGTLHFVFADYESAPDDLFPDSIIPAIFLFVGILGLIGLVVHFLHPKQIKRGWIEYWKDHVMQKRLDAFILCISSPFDEAWQILHHVRNTHNPLAPKSSFINFLVESRSSHIQQIFEIERINGASVFSEQSISRKVAASIVWLLAVVLFIPVPSLFEAWMGPRTEPEIIDIDVLFYALIAVWLVLSLGLATVLTFIFGRSFYSVLLVPVRWLVRQARATSWLMKDVGTYVARRRGWSLLQEMVSGLEGYSFKLPRAEREPTFAPPDAYKYETLPKKAEQRALAKREKWVTRAFGDVTDTLSKMAAPDVTALLKTLETDLSLVHAAYYIDEECIKRVADWIAGTTPEATTEDANLLSASVYPAASPSPR
jgi:hypothetical protein